MTSGIATNVRLKGISKSFLGVPVLQGVDLELRGGEVHALMGENGAGKSTLLKVLAGVHRPDGGTIEVDGAEVSFAGPTDAQRAGIAIIHQEFTLLPHRSVAENVYLGREPVRRMQVDRRRMVADTRELLDWLGEDGIDPTDAVSSLSVAQRQVVEIVKALSTDARVLGMDEPTAALADHEVELLYDLVRRLRERGIAILYVSHRMREVFDLSDRITVLKDGRFVTCAPTGELTSEDLVRHMVGRDLGEYYPDRAAPDDLGPVVSRCAAPATTAFVSWTSRCAPERSSGWPGCRDLAARRSHARCSASSRSPGAWWRWTGWHSGSPGPGLRCASGSRWSPRTARETGWHSASPCATTRCWYAAPRCVAHAPARSRTSRRCSTW